jgi:hypothetical protein
MGRNPSSLNRPCLKRDDSFHMRGGSLVSDPIEMNDMSRVRNFLQKYERRFEDSRYFVLNDLHIPQSVVTISL